MSASQQPRVYVDEARAELVSVALDRFRGPLRVISADVMAAAVSGHLGRAESALDELAQLVVDTRARLRKALEVGQ